MNSFRYDIAFLRAFAVIVVVLFHYKFPYFEGGFIGVDIFFVISGFLMTSIVLQGFQKNSFNLLEFYKKRVQRIWPALVFVIILTFVALMLLIPTQNIDYCKNAAASLLFYSNYKYFFDAGYFSPAAHLNFLLHTWSLSVEWQFYMIYPIGLLAVRKFYLRSPDKFTYGFLAAFVSMVILMYVSSRMFGNLNFYSLHSRAWEMMAGGLPFLFSDRKVFKSKLATNALAGILFIVICIYIMRDWHGSNWPRLQTVVPVLATAGIIFLKPDIALFRSKIILFFSNISYSWYLSHWPIWVISEFFDYGSTYLEKFILLVLSIGVATLSYQLIEKRKIKWQPIIGVQTAGIAIVLLMPFFVNFIFNDKTASLIYYKNEYRLSDAMARQYSKNIGHLETIQNFADYPVKLWAPAAGKENIILLGDSHAGMFSEEMKKKFPAANIIQITADGTFPSTITETQYPEALKLFKYFFQQYLPANHSHISKVYISANYGGYTETQILNYVDNLEQELGKYKFESVYLGQTPSFDQDFPTLAFIHDKNVYSKQVAHYQKIDALLQKRLGTRYVSLINMQPNPISEDNIPLIYDIGHVSNYGANYYLSKIK